jgi:hypothetical protein
VTTDTLVLDHDPFIPLNEVKNLPDIPRARTGRPKDNSVVQRWVHRGCLGIKLESWLVGGRRYTRRSAVLRFLRRLNEERTRQPLPISGERELVALEAELDRQGL